MNEVWAVRHMFDLLSLSSSQNNLLVISAPIKCLCSTIRSHHIWCNCIVDRKIDTMLQHSVTENVNYMKHWNALLLKDHYDLSRPLCQFSTRRFSIQEQSYTLVIKRTRKLYCFIRGPKILTRGSEKCDWPWVLLSKKKHKCSGHY